MAIPPGVLFAVVLVLLIVMLVMLTKSRARSSSEPVSLTKIDAGESVTIQSDSPAADLDFPPADPDKGGRYVLSGNFSGATIFLGADAKDMNLSVRQDEPDETDTEGEP